MDYLFALIIFIFILFLTRHFLVIENNSIAGIPSLSHVPFLGSLPFIPDFKNLHVLMSEKSKQLGNVVGFYLSKRFIVVLNGRDAIHEALVKQSNEFAGRPLKSTISLYNLKSLGIVDHAYDEHFKKYHGLALNIMKQFGFGKSMMEDRIKIEVAEFINKIEKLEGRSIIDISFKKLIRESIVNVMLGILFGNRMDQDDTEFQRILYDINYIANTSIVFITTFFPFLTWIPRFNRLKKKHLECEIDIYKFIENQIGGHSENCFIQEFISKEGANYDRDQLNFTLRDLFLAGTDSTATTLQWIFLLLGNHLNLQQDIQAQIDEVLDKNTMVSITDKSHLPLLEAFILELMRFKTFAPLGVVHMTTKDTVVQGKCIPANTWVIPNLYSANMDSSLWKDPETFLPSRFLDEKGIVINRNLMMSFSLGKRSCFGEILARQELFLFTGNLLHHYTIYPPQDQTKVTYSQTDEIFAHPHNYCFRFSKRL